jgi:hypothetical protein
VEYLHTNKTNLLVQIDQSNYRDDEVPEEYQKDFQVLLTLTAAAAYYGLQKFRHEVNQCLSSYLKTFPLLAIALLEACAQQGPVIPDDLKQGAMSIIQKLLLGKDFDPDMLEIFSPTAIELILVDAKAFLSEERCFWLIDLWCRSGSPTQDRTASAKQLVTNHVNLHLIDPDVLSTSVTSSGLVTLEQLAETYKYQAIQAKLCFNISFSKQRKNFLCINPTWSETNSETFTNIAGAWQTDTLRCPILLDGGRYTWTVKVIRENHVWLGVALSSVSDTVAGSWFAGYMPGCFGFYGTDGLPYSCGQKGASLGSRAILRSGDCVTMTLDLSSEEEHNGTLSVSVNGQPPVIILADMLSRLPSGDNQGFVPIACCFQSGVTVECIKEC